MPASHPSPKPAQEVLIEELCRNYIGRCMPFAYWLQFAVTRANRSGHSANTHTAPANAAERGRIIFENGGVHEGYRLDLVCANCHTFDGTIEDDVYGGPSMLGIAERAADRIPELSAEEYIRQSILDPSTFVTEGFGDRMAKGIPLYLSEDEVADLVAFLMNQ